MQHLNFTEVTSDQHIERVAALAEIVWHEHFTTIISSGQIDYMVEKFQSAAALTDQIREKGYQYYLLQYDGEDVGYTGFHKEDESIFLSKLYLLKQHRGKGFASRTFEFLEEKCKEYKLGKIWLTVNRYNDHTIQVYEKKGFLKARTQVSDIGNGFVMDDYIMEKVVDI